MWLSPWSQEPVYTGVYIRMSCSFPAIDAFSPPPGIAAAYLCRPSSALRRPPPPIPSYPSSFVSLTGRSHPNSRNALQLAAFSLLWDPLSHHSPPSIISIRLPVYRQRAHQLYRRGVGQCSHTTYTYKPCRPAIVCGCVRVFVWSFTVVLDHGSCWALVNRQSPAKLHSVLSSY